MALLLLVDMNRGMTRSEPETEDQRKKMAEPPRPAVSLVGLTLAAAVALPTSLFIVAWALIIVTNNLDVAYALGVSDTFLSGLLVAASGLIAGLVVALISKRRGWALAGPPVVGAIVGLGIYLGFVSFEQGGVLEVGRLGLVTIGVGQMIAIVAATRITGRRLTGLVAGVLVLGVGVVGIARAIPPAPAEVMLVLDVYTVVDSTGECAGADGLAGLVEGSEVSLLELPGTLGQSTEVGSVTLPKGYEEGGACVFELGDPLGRSVMGYADIDFLPESDPGVPHSVSLEGGRVVVDLHPSES